MPSAIQFADRTRALLNHGEASTNSVFATASLPIRLQVNAALDRGETHYTDRPGILPLRQKIADSLKRRFGIPVDAQHDLIVTCGVTEARFVTVQQLLKPGQTIAAPVLPDRIFGPALLRQVLLRDKVAPEADFLYLPSSMPEEQMRSSLAATSADCRVLFEVDEDQSHFHPSQIGSFQDRTVTLGGLGEESWRVGYIASPANLSSALRDFKQALTICTTNLSQWAALAFEEQP